MAGNITLPKVQSQARVVSPTQSSRPQPSSTAAILGTVADTFVRVSEMKNNADRQEAILAKQANLDAQKAEDNLTVATAISDVNTMLGEREEAQAAQNTLQSMSADVERAYADGDITEDDKLLKKSFIAQFEKVKTAQSQGLYDDNAFSIRAREAKQQMIARHPHLAADIDKIYNVTTGKQASTSTGAVAKQQLQFNRNMESKYGLGYTAADVMAETSKQRATAVAAENLELGKATGTLDFGNVVSAHNTVLNSAIDSISLKASNLYGPKQALTADELGGINTQIEDSKRAFIRGLDKDIAALRKQGRVIDPAQVRAQKEYALKQFNDLQTFVNDKDLQKVLVKRNQLEKEFWQAGLGGEIGKLNQMAATLGSGGLTNLSAFIGSANPAQDQAVMALAQDSGMPMTPGTMANTKQLMIDAAARVGNPVNVPGYEKLDAFYGLGAMKAGTTTPTVQTNTLRNIGKLVKNPQDVSGAIMQLNDPKISLNLSKGDDSVKNELVQTANGFESMMFAEIEQNGYAVVYDNNTESLLVTRPEKELTDVGFAGVLGLGTVSDATTIKKDAINTGLTKSMNELLKFHKNPNYSGIVQPANKWLSDITNKFNKKPEATTAE